MEFPLLITKIHQEYEDGSCIIETDQFGTMIWCHGNEYGGLMLNGWEVPDLIILKALATPYLNGKDVLYVGCCYPGNVSMLFGEEDQHNKGVLIVGNWTEPTYMGVEGKMEMFDDGSFWASYGPRLTGLNTITNDAQEANNVQA